MPYPLLGKELLLIQPDGSHIEACIWGNQHRASFTTAAGQSLTKDVETGFYIPFDADNKRNKRSGSKFTFDSGTDSWQGIANSLPYVVEGLPELRMRWMERRLEEQRQALEGWSEIEGPVPQHKVAGEFWGLCLLIDFPDVPATIPKEEVERYCNDIGYTGFGNNGSVFDYFLDNSGGLLKYRNIVTPYYTAKNNKSYYCDPKATFPFRAQELVNEALSYFVRNNFDFSRLSLDNGQFVHAINVFYAGGLINDYTKGLWPHSMSLYDPPKLGQGIIGRDYQICYMDAELSLGTFCHENGHMICNFPDLYQYDNPRKGIGSYCLMCGGGNANPKNPTEIGAFLKFDAGWAGKILQLNPGTNITLEAGKNHFGILKKTGREFFIIENRQQARRDQALADAGLAIWLVDRDGRNTRPISAKSHYECILIQADARNDLEQGRKDDNSDLYKAPHFSSFGNSSHPPSNWWDGLPSGLEMMQISASGEVMQFSIQ